MQVGSRGKHGFRQPGSDEAVTGWVGNVVLLFFWRGRGSCFCIYIA